MPLSAIRLSKATKLNFTILLISSIAAFSVAEFTLRALEIKPLTILSCRRPDMIYHHGFVPSSECRFRTKEWDVLYNINKFGHHDHEFPFEKLPNQKRILMLGDSFTEGYGVSRNQNFSYLIQLQLNSVDPTAYEVINAGVSGRSPLMEYFYLKEEGIHFDPDLVILNFDLTDFHDDFVSHQQLVKNQQGEPVAIPDHRLRPLLLKKLNLDPPKTPEPSPTLRSFDTSPPASQIIPQAHAQDVESTQSSSFNPRQKFTVKGKTTLPLVPLFVKKLLHKSLLYTKTTILIKNTLNQSSPAWTWQPGDPNHDPFAPQRPRNNQEYQQLINAPLNSLILINDLLAEQDTPFVVVIYPHGHQVSARAWSQGRLEHGFEANTIYPTKPQEDFVKLLNDNNIESVNLIPGFLSSQKPHKLFFNFDGHLTPKGHIFFTDVLIDHPVFSKYVQVPKRPS